MESRRIHKVPGIGAAGEPCASSGIAAPITIGGSTATPPCTAIATAAGRCSASPTTRHTSHAERTRTAGTAMSPLEVSLAAAALLVGLTGAWSPCGFSMVETVGLAGDEGRRRTTIAACATFAPGAILGGVVTFGLLALLGEATHGAGAQLAYLIAAGIAVAAAVAEARGMRIVP